MLTCIIILIIAFILDCILGDPVYKFHPVKIIGNLITYLEKRLYHLNIDKLISGFILAGSVISIIISGYIFVYFLLENYLSKHLAYLLNIYLAYSCISLKDLIMHSRKVSAALSISLTEARKEVQMIVGRDANFLSFRGIIKATIESIAESFVDGVLSPFFWFTVGALAGIIFNTNLSSLLCIVFVLLQRIVNTLDSMVGYKDNRYILFGRFSAKTDDFFNFIPARLSIFIIAAAAFFLHLDYRNSIKIAFRDRLKHASPNSAHPEAAVAGAFGIRLGGPTYYQWGKVDKPFLGDNLKKIDKAQIITATKLIAVSSCISLLLSIILILFSRG